MQQDTKQQLPFEEWVKGLDQLHSRSDLHGQRTTPGYEAGTSGIDLKRLYDHPHRDKLLAESRNIFGHYIMPSGFEAQPTDTRLMEGKTTEGYDFTLLAQDAKVGDDEPKTAGDVWRDFSLGGFVPYWAGVEEAGKLGKVYTAARDLEANGADADPENFKLVQEWLADQQRERTFWGGAAEMGLQMPAFIMEFMSSAGLVTAARKGATKLTGKALRELVEAQVSKLSAVRGMGLIGGGLANTAQAAAMAGVMTPRAQASAWRRAMPEMALQEDAEAASIVMMGTSKEFTEALPAGYIDTWIEVMSEKAGELTIGALAKVPYVNKLGVFQASMMKRYLDKNPTRTTRDFLEMVSKESGWTRVVNEIGIQDPFTEVAEERLGDAMRTAILGDEWDWPSAEQFAQELVVFSGLGAAKAPATFRNQRRAMEALERQAQAEEQQTERNRQVFEGKERGEEIAGKDRDGKQAVVTQVGEGTYRLVNEDGTLDVTASAGSPEEAIEQMGKLAGFEPDTDDALQGPEEDPSAPEPTPVQEAEEQPEGPEGPAEALPEEPVAEPEPELVAEPVAEPEPELVAEPVAEPEPEPLPDGTRGTVATTPGTKHKWSGLTGWWKVHDVLAERSQRDRNHKGQYENPRAHRGMLTRELIEESEDIDALLRVQREFGGEARTWAHNRLEQLERGDKPKTTLGRILSRHLDEDKLDLTPEERDFGFRTAVPELDELNRVEPDPVNRKTQLKLYDALMQALVGSGQDVDAVLEEATKRGYGQQARDVLEAFATGVSELRNANSLEVESAEKYRDKWSDADIEAIESLNEATFDSDEDQPDVLVRSSTGRIIAIGYEPLKEGSAPHVHVEHDYDMTGVRDNVLAKILGRAGDSTFRVSEATLQQEDRDAYARLGFAETVDNPGQSYRYIRFTRGRSEAEKRVERRENARRRWEEHRLNRGSARDATFIEWLSLNGGAHNTGGDLDNWTKKEVKSLGLPPGWKHPVRPKSEKPGQGSENDYILDAMVQDGWAETREQLDEMGTPEDVILDYLERNPRLDETTRLEEEQDAAEEAKVQRAMEELYVSREMAEALLPAVDGEAWFIPVRDLKRLMGEEEAEFAMEMNGSPAVADLVPVADFANEIDTLDDMGKSYWMSMSFEERDRLEEESALGIYDWSEKGEADGDDPWDDPQVTVAEMPRTDPDMFGETEEKPGTRPDTGGDSVTQGTLLDEDTGQRGQTSLLDEEYQREQDLVDYTDATLAISNVWPGEKQSPDIYEGVQTGMPARVRAFRGHGRTDFDEVYGPGATGPILGDAGYYAVSRRRAEMFGPEIEEVYVLLSNPYIIKSVADVDRMSGEKGIPYTNEERGPLFAKVRKAIDDAGHDGVIVVVPAYGDIAPDGSSIKRLRETFGQTQVVSFSGKSEEVAPEQSPAEPKDEPEEDSRLDQMVRTFYPNLEGATPHPGYQDLSKPYPALEGGIQRVLDGAFADRYYQPLIDAIDHIAGRQFAGVPRRRDANPNDTREVLFELDKLTERQIRRMGKDRARDLLVRFGLTQKGAKVVAKETGDGSRLLSLRMVSNAAIDMTAHTLNEARKGASGQPVDVRDFWNDADQKAADGLGYNAAIHTAAEIDALKQIQEERDRQEAERPTTSKGDQELDEIKRALADFNEAAKDFEFEDPTGGDLGSARPMERSKEEKREFIRKVAGFIDRLVKAGVNDFGDAFDMMAQASKGKGVDYVALGWTLAFKQAPAEQKAKMTPPHEAAEISKEKIHAITTGSGTAGTGAESDVRSPGEAGGGKPDSERVPAETARPDDGAGGREQRPDAGVESGGERERASRKRTRPDQPSDPAPPAEAPARAVPDVEAISSARDRADRFRRLDRGRVSELGRSASALVDYQALSGMTAQGLLMSGRLGNIINQAVRELELEVGDIDAWVADKLGYESKAELEGKLYGEQVDAVALSIRAIEKGEGIIIGDETGTGKGRISAAILRYAHQQGMIGVWVTKTKQLYKDASRDFAGIGLDDGDIKMMATDNNLSVEMDPKFSASNLSQGAMKERLEGMAEKLEALERPAKDASDAEVSAYKKELKSIMGGANTVMSTYSQLNPDKHAVGRVKFMEALAKHAVIVMDESHEAAGVAKKTSNPPGFGFKIFKEHTSDNFRRIVSKSLGGVFLSATFAKTAENFGLYMTTPLGVYGRHVGAAIASGGVPMLQHVSSALAESLSMIRRQRDFSGATFEVSEVKGVSESGAKVFRALEMLMELDRNLQQMKGPMSRRLAASAEYGVTALSSMKDGDLPPDLAGYRWTVNPEKETKAAMQLTLANFLHSMMSTVLLSMKARQVALDAVKAHKEGGYKVMIALQRTGASALEGHIENKGLMVGDDVGEYGIKDALLTQLRRSRLVVYKAHAPIHDETKDKNKEWLDENYTNYPEGHKYTLTEEDTNAEFETLYKETEEYISDLDLSDLPGSPIDEMIEVLEGAGLRVGELTGRDRMVVDGKLKARPRGVHHNTQTIAAFNGDGVEATIDVLIGNRSVDTGVSMHSSKDFGDQSPRLMLMAEMFDDINGLMQMLGRIGRAGQVHPPTYHFVSSEIPAEKRYMVQTSKRMASLSSTSTGEEKGNFDLSIDFINRFGDQVVTDFLRSNPDLTSRMNLSLPDNGTADGIANKVALRAVILQPEEQAELFGQLEENYVSMLEARAAMGEEISGTRSLDLDAVLLERSGYLPAIIEGNEDELTGPTFLEKVDVKRQFKPESPEAIDEKYPSSEVDKQVDRLVNQITGEWEDRLEELKEKLAQVESEAGEKLKRRNERQRAAHEKRVEAAAKKGETPPLPPPELSMARADMQKIASAKSAIKKNRDAFDSIVGILNNLKEKRYILLLPSNATVQDLYESTSYRFCGVKVANESANPESMSRYTVKLYGHEGVFDLPVSALRPDSDVSIGVTSRPQWEKQIRSGMHGREERYILTGNLIHPSMVGGAHNGVMVEYTHRDGDRQVLRQGILLPKAITPSSVGRESLLPEQYLASPSEAKVQLEEAGFIRMAAPLDSAFIEYKQGDRRIEIKSDATQAVRSVLFRELPKFVEAVNADGHKVKYGFVEGSSGPGEKSPDTYRLDNLGDLMPVFVDWLYSSDFGPGIRLTRLSTEGKGLLPMVQELDSHELKLRSTVASEDPALKEDVEADAPPLTDAQIDELLDEGPDSSELEGAETGNLTWYGSEYSGITANMGESLYKGKIKSRQELTQMAVNVIKDRKMVTRFGTNQRNRYGWYSFDLDITRIKEAHDAATQAHELGHAVQRNFFPKDSESYTGYATLPEGWGGESMKSARKDFQRELMDLGRKAYGSTKPKGGYKSEGWAEFFRLYMTKPERAQSLAPTVYNWFHGKIRRENPDMYEAIEAYRLELRKRILASPQQRALADQAKADAMLTRLQRVKDYWSEDGKFSGRSFIVDWIDQNHPFRELDAFVEGVIRDEGDFGYQLLNKDGLLRPSQSIYRTASALQMTHAARAAFFVDHYTTDIAGNRVGEPLGKIKEWIKPKEWKDFAIYLWARRSLALANHPDYAKEPTAKKYRHARQGGLSVDEALALVRNLEEGREGSFRSAAEHIYRWNNDLLNYAAGASRQLARSVARIRSIDPGNYVPLWSVFQQLDGSYRSGGSASVKDAQTGRLAKRLRGSMNVPTNVMVSMLQNAEHIIKTTHQRVILERIYQYRNVPGVGHLIEELPAKQDSHSARVGELVAKLNKALGGVQVLKNKQDEETGDWYMDDLELEDLQVMTSFFFPVMRTDNDTVRFVMIDEGPATGDMGPTGKRDNQRYRGKIKLFELKDPLLLEALMGEDPSQASNIIATIFMAHARMWRLGTVAWRASFGWVTNPQRDVRTFWMQTRVQGNPMWNWSLFKDLIGMLASTFMYQVASEKSRAKFPKWMEENAKWLDRFYSLGGEIATPVGEDINMARRSAARITQSPLQRAANPMNWLDWLATMVQIPEGAIRATELKNVAKMKEITSSQYFTPDMAIEMAEASSEVTVNFRRGGLRARSVNRYVPFFTATINGWVDMIGAYNRNPGQFILKGMTSIMFPAIAAWMMIRDDEWYKELPANMKFQYLYLRIGDDVVQIRQPHETGTFFGSSVVAMLESAYRDGDNSMDEFAWFALQTMSPSITPPLASEIIEQAANEDFFFDRPIVPRSMDGRVYARDQYGPYTTWSAKALGSIFNQSPLRIDHAIRGIFGSAIPDAIRSSEALLGLTTRKRHSEPSDIPILGSTFRRGGATVTQSKTIDALYDLKEKAELIQFSPSVEETESQRQRRLLVSDATRAIGLLSYVRQYTEGRAERGALTREMVGIAKDAVEAYNGDMWIGNDRHFLRQRMRNIRKQAQRRKEFAQ